MTPVVQLPRGRRRRRASEDWTPARRAAELAKSARRASEQCSLWVRKALDAADNPHERMHAWRAAHVYHGCALVWAMNAGRVAQGLPPSDNPCRPEAEQRRRAARQKEILASFGRIRGF